MQDLDRYRHFTYTFNWPRCYFYFLFSKLSDCSPISFQSLFGCLDNRNRKWITVFRIEGIRVTCIATSHRSENKTNYKWTAGLTKKPLGHIRLGDAQTSQPSLYPEDTFSHGTWIHHSSSKDTIPTLIPNFPLSPSRAHPHTPYTHTHTHTLSLSLSLSQNHPPPRLSEYALENPFVKWH